MSQFCPYLGTGGEDDTRGPAQDYPSFENQCFAVEFVNPLMDGLQSRDQLLLTDQATYCLGQTHHLCPRFRLLHRQEALAVADETELPLAEDAPFLAPVRVDDFALEADDYASADGPRLGFWVGIGAFLLVFLLCGGSLATYTGWQLVDRGLVPFNQQLGQLAQPTEEREQVFLLVTPTPAAVTIHSPLSTATHTPVFEFPKAVTPTPTAEPVQSGDVVITTPTSAQPGNTASEGEPPADPSLATAVAGPVAISTPGGPLVPTRRPTPAIVVPTSTPGSPEVVVVTATPTPGYPEPTVVFQAAHQSLSPESCTTLFWEVEHVRAVFLDSEGVNGKGERRVCLREQSGTFTLSVLLLDGTSKDYPITIPVVPYTPTPTLTPTPTPVLTPTPTWTPEGGEPAPNPEPPRQGVELTIDGGNQQNCQVGQLCQVVLQVANTGTLADEIFIDLSKQGPWSVQVCRPDDVCGETSISVGVGPGSQIPISLRAAIPADGQGQSYTFQLIGASGNSNRTVRSAPALLTLNVP